MGSVFDLCGCGCDGIVFLVAENNSRNCDWDNFSFGVPISTGKNSNGEIILKNKSGLSKCS